MPLQDSSLWRLLAIPALAAISLAPSAAQCDKIIWGPCTDLTSSVPIVCGSLAVPLDYTSTCSNATLRLELVKVPAAKEPVMGSIQFNFGGPGLSARHDMASAGRGLLAITGGHHNLIAFDPRGTGNTLLFSCYQDETSRLVNNLIARDTSNASEVASGILWGMGRVIADTCYGNAKETGELIGTAFVARDLMQVADALEEDGLLRYWGLSYGTTLGATVASMFPDRMDKVILDGVLNPHEYFFGWDVEWFTGMDKTFSSFFAGCAANPDNCALKNYASAAEMEAAVFALLDTIKYRPVPFGPILLEYSILKKAIVSALYDPGSWPQLATAFNAFLTNNLTQLVEFADQTANSPIAPDKEALQGIRCSDKTLRLGDLTEFLPTMERLHNVSRIGGDIFTSTLLQCANWLMNAKERPAPGFNASTRKPILLIGNTWDPVTPLISAFNVSAGFEGSVVLTHNGHGHSSLAQPSSCTITAIQAYFLNGTLPETGTVCEPDTPIFAVADSASARFRRAAKDRKSNAALLEAATEVGKTVLRRHIWV